jgi:hypothetical protein
VLTRRDWGWPIELLLSIILGGMSYITLDFGVRGRDFCGVLSRVTFKLITRSGAPHKDATDED